MNLQQERFLREADSSEKSLCPMSEEHAFWHAVSTGDLEYVRQNCRQNKSTEAAGILSRDPVTNLKYHMVITSALVCRLCVERGLPLEQARLLNGFYLLKLDGTHTVQGVADLHDQMLLDFTGRMYLLNGAASGPVADCMNYICAHIQERITVDGLASFTGLSASHLSRLFKRETGVSVSDYIREKKMERAQEMLRSWDCSLAEISDGLSFSSQSHFTQIFRSFTGMTPKKYRDLYAGGPRGEGTESVPPNG